MPVHTFARVSKRRAVEFRTTRSPRDVLLTLPVRWVEGKALPLVPSAPCDPEALQGVARDAA